MIGTVGTYRSMIQPRQGLRVTQRAVLNMRHRLMVKTSLRCSSADGTDTTNHNLSIDRDTGVVWEATSSSLRDTKPSDETNNRLRPLYQTIIGIEIHAQLSVPTKLFSAAPTRHNHSYASEIKDAVKANVFVHPYDLAYPGTLPTLSMSAVKASLISAAAMNCEIHEISRFERKHYFYPDLPNGYQITQQRWPLASNGFVDFYPWSNNQGQMKKEKEIPKRRRREPTDGHNKLNRPAKTIAQSNQGEPENVHLRIERIQLEQDTGKTTTHSMASASQSQIDFNRAGCALIEIVSYPDLRSAHEAAGAVEKIRKLLKHIGTCDGRMEDGSLRCDLNVSIAPILKGDLERSQMQRPKLPEGNGHRVEVKNLNSLRQIISATEYEVLRQSILARNNRPTGRETRTFHVKPISKEFPLGGETVIIREKGDSVDYRFMPEPDIPPLVLNERTLGSNLKLEEFIEQNMPELPQETVARLMKDYGISQNLADLITNDPPAIKLFENAVETAKMELNDNESSDPIPTMVGNWLCNDLFALVKKSATEDGNGNSSSETHNEEESHGSLNHPISVEFSTVKGDRLGSLIALIVKGIISTSMAKKILSLMFKENLQSSPMEIAKSNGWRVVSDMDTLIKLCESVVFDPQNSSQLEQYREGGKFQWKIEKFLIGKVMAASNGNAHPERLKEALSSVLQQVSSESPQHNH
ncbi:hypothetical protein ACHAXS_002674 [Conticribra weissflogii]